MLLLCFGFTICSLLEKTLLVEGDVQKAITHVETNEGKLDYFYSYFLKRRFMSKEKEALLGLLESDDYMYARSIVLLHLSMSNFPSSDKDAEFPANLYINVCNKVSEKYLENSYAFLSRKPLNVFEKKEISKKEIEDIIVMIYTGDDSSIKLFLNILDQKLANPGEYIGVLKYLASKNVSRAFGYLGDIYYYGLNVDKSCEIAMNYYSQGKELNDFLSYNGVGRILLSEEYDDKKNAISILHMAQALGAIGETSYLLYKATSGNKGKNDFSNAYLERSVMFGYLPAIFLDGERYFKRKEYRNACIRLGPIISYTDLIYDLHVKGKALYQEKKYKQAALAFLMQVELGENLIIPDLIYILKRNSRMFPNQNEILFNLYLNATEKGDYSYLNDIGDAYFYGKGTKQSYSDAFSYYITSSALGQSHGYYNMSYMYEKGYGTEVSLGYAFYYMLKIDLNDQNYLLLLYSYIRMFISIILFFIINKYILALIFGLAAVKIASVTITK